MKNPFDDYELLLDVWFYNNKKENKIKKWLKKLKEKLTPEPEIVIHDSKPCELKFIRDKRLLKIKKDAGNILMNSENPVLAFIKFLKKHKIRQMSDYNQEGHLKIYIQNEFESVIGLYETKIKEEYEELADKVGFFGEKSHSAL